MSDTAVKWGVVTTIKAPARDILEFAAHYIEAGAHRIYIYLDAPCPEARPLLKAHPRIRLFDCDDASWQKREKSGKPEKHQVRQTKNATRTYRRQAREVDWLIHLDVDEFLWSERPVNEILGALGNDVQCARVFPIESLAGDGTAFKGLIPKGPERVQVAARLYPTFGEHMKGGFLSHVQGKLFVRPGMEQAKFRIHNIMVGDIENPNLVELSGIDLCHFHARSWDQWLGHYRYRHAKGSYRSDLGPKNRDERVALNLHDLFHLVESESGTDGLRHFFDEVCADTPDHRQRLQAEGLLRIIDLELDRKRQKHFPDFG